MHVVFEKKIAIFSPKTRCKKFFFLTFFVLQRLVFKIWRLLTQRTFFCAPFGGKKKKILLSQEDALKKTNFFLSISGLRTLVFHFFRASKTFFSNLIFIKTNNSLMNIFWLYLEKIFTYDGASKHFLKKYFCHFFTQIEI